MRKRVFLSAALAILMIATPRMALGADGSAACTNDTSPHHFLYTIDVLAQTGYYSHLDPQDNPICSGNSGGRSGSFAFAAVQTQSCTPANACPSSIIQVGRGRCVNQPSCSGGHRLFSAWGANQEAPGCQGHIEVLATPVDRGAAPGGSGLHYYRVYTDGTNWYFDHWPKGQAVVPAAPPINSSHICWTERMGVTFNESWDKGDAVGGHAANHYNFISMTRRETISGGWFATLNQPCAKQPNPDPDGIPTACLATAAQAWEGWTNR